MRRILEENETDDPFLEKSSEVVDPPKLGKFSDKVMPFFRLDTSDGDKGKILHKALTKFGHVGFRCATKFQSFSKFSGLQWNLYSVGPANWSR